jgi:hypothetical protein
MVRSIVTLLVIGVVACEGTHRNRFRQAPRTRQRPAVGLAPLHRPGRVNRNAVGCWSSDPRFPASPANQEYFDHREREHATQTEAKERANN